MDDALLQTNANAFLEGDADVKMGSKMTQSDAVLSSCLKKRTEKNRRRKQRRKCNLQKQKVMDDNSLKGSPRNVRPIKSDTRVPPASDTCPSTDLEIMQHDTQVILCQNIDCREKQNASLNALESNNTDQHLEEGDRHLVEGAHSSSTNKHDDHSQVDINSCNVGGGKTSKRKKQARIKQRKRRKISKPKEISSGSTKEDFSSPVPSVPDSSAGDSSLRNLDESRAEKMMGEVVVEHGTSFLGAGDVLPEKALSVCPNGEPANKEHEEKIQMENLEEIINMQTVLDDVSHVDLPGRCSDEGNMDNLDVKQNAILDDSAKEVCHISTSDEVSGSDPSVEKLECENLVIQLKLEDAMASSLQLDEIKDDVISAIIEKGGPQQRFQSSAEVSTPANLRKKLLVLDVNGLLADIVPYVSEGYTPDTIISRKSVFKRPFCDDFLQFCFEKFHVGVWSSRTKRNVESVLDFLMGKSKQNLLFCWDQSHCTDTGYNTVENRDKPLLLKELKKLWEKHEPNLPWERGEYNESNTLLLDDSPYKALRNPRHTAIFPISYQYKDANDNSLGPNGDLRTYLEGLALADNVQKYIELNPFGQRPITETNLSWGFYLKIIGTTSSIKQEDDNDSSGCHNYLRNDHANYYQN